MSSAPPSGPRGRRRLVQAGALVVIAIVLSLAVRISPSSHPTIETIAALGFLMLAGTLLSELLEPVGLPHITGYLLCGLLFGPHVLGLVKAPVVVSLAPVNTIALALIALAGGAELRLDSLRKNRRSLSWATLLQHSLVPLATGLAFFALAPLSPFAGMPVSALVGVAVLWGMLAASRSPAVLLGVFSELRPKGPLSAFSLAFVMFSDLVIILMMAVAIALVRPLFDPAMALSFGEIRELGFDMLGSATLGGCVGIALAIYFRLTDRSHLIVLFAVSVGLSELIRYVRFDALLCFLVAGFVVRNFTDQGEKLLHAIHQTGILVFAVFFAVAGAKVDLALLAKVGPVAIVLCVARAASTWGAGRLSSYLANDEPTLKRWAFAPLISQAGLTIGLTEVIARAFPSIAAPFRALALAAVAIHELVGPILLKTALVRTGEAEQAEAQG
jgi:Kef-type K+ transport system membrane component KefB